MPWSDYKEYASCKQALLAKHPFCAYCGVAHDDSPLEYHHIVPKRFRRTQADHKAAVLLCADCHQHVSNIQRLQHKKINADGYRAAPNIVAGR